MTDTRFTPGPWHVERGHDEDGAETETLHICHPATVCENTTVCQVWGGREADAHLIAAAPAMFEALEHILNGALSLPRFAEEAARAALNQARGL